MAPVTTFNNATYSNQMTSLVEGVNDGGFTIDTDSGVDRVVIPVAGNYSITWKVSIAASNALLTAQRYQIQTRIRRSSSDTVTTEGLPAYGLARGELFAALSLADAESEVVVALDAGDLIWGEIASQRKGLGTATATVNGEISIVRLQVGTRGPAGPAGDAVSALPDFDATDAGQVLTVNSAGDDADWEDVDAAPTAAEVKTLYESNADTNAFDDMAEAKLAGIEDSATADQTAAEIKTLYETNTDTNAFTDADETKLDGIETGATGDQTAAEIKAQYETNADTNAFTDADNTKLTGIAAGAEVNVNADWDAVSGDAEIENKPEVLPDSYGTTGQVLQVDSAATGSEWADAGASTFTGLTDTPDSLGTTGQVAAINDDADGFFFGDIQIALTVTQENDNLVITATASVE